VEHLRVGWSSEYLESSANSQSVSIRDHDQLRLLWYRKRHYRSDDRRQDRFLAQERVADAVVALRKATELKPGYAPAQLKLAELMLRSRDDAETRIQKDPDGQSRR
jgi:hypothetical protein